jgi:prepilin-type N-terminal cleavage/methylation domain-containing protein
MLRNTDKKDNAFTLIELLIVVAIIAILAAIAVPNFLEAQTRAKVARVKADMRTVATAIESYSIDYNEPPLGYFEVQLWRSPNGKNYNPWHYQCWEPWGDQESHYWKVWAQMTTPIAYITSVPTDPFVTRGYMRQDGLNMVRDIDRHFRYQALYANTRSQWATYLGTPMDKCEGKGIPWALISMGPSRAWSWGKSIVPFGQPMQGNPIKFIAGEPDNLIRGPGRGPAQWGYPGAAYDPTNGTVSYGMIFRSAAGQH